MPKEQIDVKMTFKLLPKDKKNLDQDIPRLNKMIGDEAGIEIDKSKLIRSFLRNVHKSLDQGLKIVWPIVVKTKKEADRVIPHEEVKAQFRNRSY